MSTPIVLAVPAAPARPVVVPLARLAAFAALVFVALVEWGGQVVPRAGGTALGGTVVAVAIAAACRQLRVPTRSRRLGAVALCILLALAGSLLASGAPARLLLPTGWSELFTGIGDAIANLGNVRVPYRGGDEWTRLVILTGGVFLASIAAIVAFLPRRPRAGATLAGALLVCLVYATPFAQHHVEHPFVSGALFTLVFGGFLLAGRIPPGDETLAGVLILVAFALGLLSAPRLDGAKAWIDVSTLAEQVGAGDTVRFDWSHRYNALDWPQDGRVVLRVKAKQSGYWKGATLDVFDGIEWAESSPLDGGEADPAISEFRSRWLERVAVRVGEMTSIQLYAPGAVQEITGLGRPTTPTGAGTVVVTNSNRPLRPGDRYVATSYVPRPEPAELRRAGTDYPAQVARNLRLTLPAGPDLEFPVYGTGGPIVATDPSFGVAPDGAERIERSAYAPVYALAQRLARASNSPYDFVRRVTDRVISGATYDESPPPADVPLVAFLLKDRRGFCQQFSGAMALLLRMGGVPARVVSGFAPGQFNGTRREWVVRDLDAHSWVEVYFPNVGWVTYDPTPPSNAAGRDVGAADRGDPARQESAPEPEPSQPTNVTQPVARDTSDSRPWPLLVVGALVGLLMLLWHRARRRSPDPLVELRTALTRTGRGQAADLTLDRLADSLGREPDARDYVRALARREYGPGGSDGPPPTPAQRRGLRRALGEGGVRQRLRAFLAVPPRRAEFGRQRSYT